MIECLGINGQHAHLKDCDGTLQSSCRFYRKNQSLKDDSKKNPKNLALAAIVKTLFGNHRIKKDAHGRYVKKDFTPEEQAAILAEYVKQQGIEGSTRLGPTRSAIVAANKSANQLLESLGLRRYSPRIQRERPETGTPRATRQTPVRNNDHTAYWKNKALLDQAGRCIFCQNLFGTEIRDLEYGETRVLTPEQEHLLPRSAGGQTTEDNINVACGICNGVKADYIFEGLLDPRLIDLIRREWAKYELVDKADHVCVCQICNKEIA